MSRTRPWSASWRIKPSCPLFWPASWPARGLDSPSAAAEFLRPGLAQLHNPFDLKGMEKAVARIAQAIERQESIWIYGDYDVDGITATAILLLTLQELGCKADYYIPHRINEGYGLNMEAVEQLAHEHAQLIITVDCGVTAVHEVQRARELGIDVIITDHHEPGPDLPAAIAVVNPKQPGCAYPFKGLAGAGVAFKLAHAILKRIHPDPEAALIFLKTLLDLAALGTVADIVPMMGEKPSDRRPRASSACASASAPGLMHPFQSRRPFPQPDRFRLDQLRRGPPAQRRRPHRARHVRR